MDWSSRAIPRSFGLVHVIAFHQAADAYCVAAIFERLNIVITGSRNTLYEQQVNVAYDVQASPVNGPT